MKIHFIGIGGIGVSALAQYYLSKGHEVSGSDLVSSEITDLLKNKGAKISLGPHSEKNIDKDIDLVVYSPAVQENNPELKKSYKLRILKVLSYPEALGELTKKYFTIAVSGTHGKSTTVAIISLILIKAGFDPTVIIGTKLKEFGNTNFRFGRSKYLVIEADEWQASFLNYWPQIIVLTNIEKEHLDYYKSLDQILETYKEYIGHLSKNGVLVINKDDENIKKLIFDNSQNQFSIKEFSKEQKEVKVLKKILQIPGQHNIYNALAALTTARALGISDRISLKTLSKYKGAWRRFEEKELKIGDCKLRIISDYGHHPTEIKATLEAVREKYPKRKIWCIFQPHQYQRTFYLFDDFVDVFRLVQDSCFVDKVIITDIYDVAGREEGKIRAKVNSEKLVKAIDHPNVIYLPKDKIKSFLKENLENKDVLVIMGAGDIYNII